MISLAELGISPRNRIQAAVKNKMTVKFSENFMLFWRGPWEYVKIIKFYINRYFRVRPWTPPNFIVKMFPNVWFVWAHDDIFCSTNRDHQEKPEEVLKKPGVTVKESLISLENSRDENWKNGVDAPFRKLDYISLPKSLELKLKYGDSLLKGKIFMKKTQKTLCLTLQHYCWSQA